MLDQAKQLRQLMRDTRHLRVDAIAAPQRIVVTGAKGGVGATTLAVQLAAELARRGRQVVLIDADLSGGDLAAICRTEDDAGDNSGLAEVLSSRRSIHEVLRRGPFGLQVVARQPNAHASSHAPMSAQRLLHHLKSLTGHAEMLVMDAGRATTDFARQIAHAADHWLLATTADDLAVMDAYAAIKMLVSETSVEALPKTLLLVNRASDEDAQAIGDRIRTTAHRFLDTLVDLEVAAMPDDSALVDTGRTGRPLVLQSPRSPAARAIERLAAMLTANRKQTTTSLQHTAHPPQRASVRFKVDRQKTVS
jgi:MinD-like ATPase involved in chromosome partitioning or flagellar assembly